VCAREDDARLYCQGPCFKPGPNNTLLIVATDGTRLCETMIKADASGIPEFGIIVPKRVCGEIDRMLADDEPTDEIELTISRAAISVRSGGNRISSRLIEGEFPQYEHIVSVKNTRRLEIEKQEMLSACARCALIDEERVEKTTVQVEMRLQLSDSVVKLSVFNRDAGEIAEVLHANWSGGEILCGFNGRFMMDILSKCDAEVIEITFGENGMKPIGFIDKLDTSTRFVLMPIAIKHAAGFGTSEAA